jgi:hypothetical protein
MLYDLHANVFCYSWIDEINQRQSELGAARITIEQLRQKEHFMVAEIDLLKVCQLRFPLEQ